MRQVNIEKEAKEARKQNAAWREASYRVCVMVALH